MVQLRLDSIPSIGAEEVDSKNNSPREKVFTLGNAPLDVINDRTVGVIEL
jgi:hypothetical protein